MKNPFSIPAAVCGLALFVAGATADIPARTYRLVSESGFGKGVNWEKVLVRYPGPLTHREAYKDFVRLPDGRFVIVDSRTYNFLLFDSDGVFVKKLWKQGRRKFADLSIYNRPEWLALGSDQRLYVSELGIVRVFDLEGRELRSAVIDHPVDNLFPLGGKSVAVSGWVMRKDLPERFFAATVDLQTGAETVMADAIDSRPEKAGYQSAPDGRKIVTVTFPHAQVRPFVRPTPEGGFLAAFTNWPEIEVYDNTGQPLRTFILKTEPAVMEKTLVEAQTEKLIALEEESKKRLVSRIWGGFGTQSNARAGAHIPTQTMPYFYNLYIDGEGRLLVFYFPKKGDAPVFQVYSTAGDLIEEATIKTGDYVIPFSPGAAGAVFDGPFLYAMAELKKAKGPSLRLMKFRMVEEKIEPAAAPSAAPPAPKK
jgi:hypothetical protein